ncbi:hypothetical protein [Luteolibacter soli]|uniref:Uncharacterized protein n=1 Tax=Luteolibacter soli TaxID=3135280 RepID=A0ABU9ATJ5_9BACT
MKPPSLLALLLVMFLPCSLVMTAGAEPAAPEEDAVAQLKQLHEKAKKELAKWTTPEMCSESDADSLYGRYIGEVGLMHDSEIWRDEFHEVHREVLEKRTNELHPEAVKFRKPLMEVFSGMLEFIHGANGGLGGHLRTRLPAQVEWNINEGYKAKFTLKESGKFTPDDIRELGLMFQRTRARYTLHMDASARDPKAFEPVLEDLRIAEQSMSKEAAMYFRACLVGMLAGYMVQ